MSVKQNPNLFRLALCSWITLGAIGCGGGDGAGSNSPSASPTRNTLGLHVGEASDGDFNGALAIAKAAGVQVVHLSLDWSALETSPDVFDPTVPNIAEAFYPTSGVKLALAIRPINTNRKEVPADLETTDFDDPTMITRFKAFLDWLFSRIPNVPLHNFIVGNEVGAYLSTTQDWEEWTAFYIAARDHIKLTHPALMVSCTGMFGSLTGIPQAEFQAMNMHTDFISVTYYPLTPDFIVHAPSAPVADFALLASLYPGRPIYIQECGYPASPTCNSSEEKQRQFVAYTYATWDIHANQIKHLSFFMQHDYTAQEVADFVAYYGFTDPAFAAFLATLGMRYTTGSGIDKPAWPEFSQGAAARGF